MSSCSKTDSGNCSAGRDLPTVLVSAGAEGGGVKITEPEKTKWILKTDEAGRALWN